MAHSGDDDLPCFSSQRRLFCLWPIPPRIPKSVQDSIALANTLTIQNEQLQKALKVEERKREGLQRQLQEKQEELESLGERLATNESSFDARMKEKDEEIRRMGEQCIVERSLSQRAATYSKTTEAKLQEKMATLARIRSHEQSLMGNALSQIEVMSRQLENMRKGINDEIQGTKIQDDELRKTLQKNINDLIEDRAKLAAAVGKGEHDGEEVKSQITQLQGQLTSVNEKVNATSKVAHNRCPDGHLRRSLRRLMKAVNATGPIESSGSSLPTLGESIVSIESGEF